MLKLSSSSALVLLWAQQDCYQSDKARDYLSKLDLEEGKVLYERCKEVWPYYDEVIKNRKLGVFTLIKKCCSAELNCQQIVIAGAGLDPLGIELTEYYPHVKVFELDKENMDYKSNLLSNANITCIEFDLLNVRSLHSSLTAHGWDPKKTTLLILEGVSYYLTSLTIKSILRAIKLNWVIFEFLKPMEEIASNRVEIPEGIFGLVSSLCEVPQISKYNYSRIQKEFNMPVVYKYSMKQLENMRTGSNRLFPTEDSGWIEVCLLANQQTQQLG